MKNSLDIALEKHQETFNKIMLEREKSFNKMMLREKVCDWLLLIAIILTSF